MLLAIRMRNLAPPVPTPPDPPRRYSRRFRPATPLAPPVIRMTSDGDPNEGGSTVSARGGAQATGPRVARRTFLEMRSEVTRQATRGAGRNAVGGSETSASAGTTSSPSETSSSWSESRSRPPRYPRARLRSRPGFQILLAHMDVLDLKKHLTDICHRASERWLTSGSGGNI